jgi:hypothetical protein
MAEVYAEPLSAARERLLEERRGLAGELAKPYERGKTEQLRERFIAVQATIDAIDRAIADERYIAAMIGKV